MALVIGLLSALFLAWVLATILVPPSVQVYIAGVAGCKNLNAALIENDARFKQVEYWERPLALVFRWKQMLFGGSFIVTDFLTNNESVFHILLTASDNTNRLCDGEILGLVAQYHKLGAPIDYYNERGYTPLQEAVITGNENFVRVLLSLGADKTLRTRGSHTSIYDMNAIEIAEFFHSKNPDIERRELITKLLRGEI